MLLSAAQCCCYILTDWVMYQLKLNVSFPLIFVSRNFRYSRKRHRGQGSQNQGRIWEEAERHEQGASEAAVCSEGARPPAEEPVAVWEAAEEASDGRGRNEEDKGMISYCQSALRLIMIRLCCNASGGNLRPLLLLLIVCFVSYIHILYLSSYFLCCLCQKSKSFENTTEYWLDFSMCLYNMNIFVPVTDEAGGFMNTIFQ